MDALSAVRGRIAERVPALAGRIEGAAAFADLMARNQLPQHTPAAHVLPLGLQGGPATIATGLYRQDVSEIVAVLITLRTASATGGAALPDLDALVEAVIAAVVGWGPEAAVGVFALRQGALVSVSAGTLVYQIDFVLQDQLRITP